MRKSFIIFAIIFTLIDMIYLSLSAELFNKQISLIQNSNIKLNYPATILCYLFLTSGIYYFIIIKKQTIFDAFLLGIFVYGVYEFTNKAIFNKWQWQTVILDTLWGGILFASSTYITQQIY